MSGTCVFRCSCLPGTYIVYCIPFWCSRLLCRIIRKSPSAVSFLHLYCACVVHAQLSPPRRARAPKYLFSSETAGRRLSEGHTHLFLLPSGVGRPPLTFEHQHPESTDIHIYAFPALSSYVLLLATKLPQYSYSLLGVLAYTDQSIRRPSTSPSVVRQRTRSLLEQHVVRFSLGLVSAGVYFYFYCLSFISSVRLLLCPLITSSPVGRSLPIVRPGWRWNNRQRRISVWDAQDEPGEGVS